MRKKKKHVYGDNYFSPRRGKRTENTVNEFVPATSLPNKMGRARVDSTRKFAEDEGVRMARSKSESLGGRLSWGLGKPSRAILACARGYSPACVPEI